MVSQNNLLGSGKVYVEEPVEKKTNRVPCLMYHKDLSPMGKVVKNEFELDALIDAGWVDHRGKIFRLPGFEKLYDEFNKINEDDD